MDLTRLSDKRLQRQLKAEMESYYRVSSGKRAKKWESAEACRAELRSRGFEVPEVPRGQRLAAPQKARHADEPKLKKASFSPLTGTFFMSRPRCKHCRKPVTLGATHCAYCGQVWSR
jgi:hypothetical protein